MQTVRVTWKAESQTGLAVFPSLAQAADWISEKQPVLNFSLDNLKVEGPNGSICPADLLEKRKLGVPLATQAPELVQTPACRWHQMT